MPEALAAPPRTLVLGASGQVGRFLLQRLGRDALACSRHQHTPPGAAAPHWQRLDLWVDTWASPTQRLISAGPLDGCVAWLQRSGPGALQRIVALASMSAMHKANSPSRREREVAARLREHEQHLQAFAALHGIACTILRPTLIWGAGMDRSLTPYAQAAARRGYALIPTGAVGLRQPVHADDLAALAVALTPCDAGSTFAVGGGERVSFATMLRRVAEAQSARVIHVPAPAFALQLLGSIATKFGFERAAALQRAVTDQCVDDSRAWHLAGIAPRGFDPTTANFIAPDPI